jgi:tRNA G18 (ribose-2'-O)-methylase SpoU
MKSKGYFMANIINITDFNDSALDVYVRLTGSQLRNKLEPEKGIFIAESPTVIEVAMNSGCTPISFLTDERLIKSGSVESIISALPEGTPIYTASRELLTSLTGFELTRGALCAMKRPALPSVESLINDARRIAVLEAVADSTNIGALFRSAAALGVDAVLVTPTCCDPLCRRAVRVSMGTIFQVPWTRIGSQPEDWPENGINVLNRLGFKTVAMALTDKSVSIDDPQLRKEEKLAIILGTEGNGLAKSTIASCDYTVKIPMKNNVDSLNVAAAGAVAFWEFTK